MKENMSNSLCIQDHIAFRFRTPLKQSLNVRYVVILQATSVMAGSCSVGRGSAIQP